jgi:hypothetical protein
MSFIDGAISDAIRISRSRGGKRMRFPRRGTMLSASVLIGLNAGASERYG